MRHRSNVLLSLVAIIVILSSANSRAEQGLSEIVDADGAIAFPEKFRTTMVHLGSWFVPAGGASGFHDVYTEAASVAYFRKHGNFPDGATLVKELRASKSGTYTTGEGVHHATDVLKQWFVMVKDSENRYASNAIWGDGWGWALFKPDNPTKNLATDYKVDCLGCHVPAQKTDWVYTEAYPILSE